MFMDRKRELAKAATACPESISCVLEKATLLPQDTFLPCAKKKNATIIISPMTTKNVNGA